MASSYRSKEEMREIAKEVMELLRPKHLTVGQIKELAQMIVGLTDYVVFREKTEEENNAAHG